MSQSRVNLQIALAVLNADPNFRKISKEDRKYLLEKLAFLPKVLAEFLDRSADIKTILTTLVVVARYELSEENLGQLFDLGPIFDLDIDTHGFGVEGVLSKHSSLVQKTSDLDGSLASIDSMVPLEGQQVINVLSNQKGLALCEEALVEYVAGTLTIARLIELQPSLYIFY